MENKDKKTPINRRKLISQICIVLLVVLVTMVVIFNLNDFNETIEIIKTLDYSYFIAALLCLILYFVTWPLSLCLIIRCSGIKNHFLDSYLIGSTEHFFNGVTPFSTGGQPIQIYLYTKKHVTAAQSTGLILTNFIAFMIATNIFAIISLVYYGRFSQNFDASTSWMIILGFAMNFFTLTFLILMATCKFMSDFFKKILLAFCKIRWIGKFLTKLVPFFDQYCENAQVASKEIFSHKLSFIGAIILRGISLTFYYAIPFFILRSLDVDLAIQNIPFIMLASAFAITTMVWVPTPGGTGGIEFAFTTIFTTFIGVTAAKGVAGMVIWRGLTYFLLLILSFIAYLIFEILHKKHKKEEVLIDDTCSSNGEL